MPRVIWPLHHGMPSVEVVLTVALTGQSISRSLLADTGAATLAIPNCLDLSFEDVTRAFRKWGE